MICKPVGLETRAGGRVSTELAYSLCQGLEYSTEQDTGCDERFKAAILILKVLDRNSQCPSA